MTTTMLITLTVLHWIIAYGIGRMFYDSKNPESTNGFGVLWIPGIGWMFIWILAAFSGIAYLDSPGFKDRFYGQKGNK
jgi:hypothetical protein